MTHYGDYTPWTPSVLVSLFHLHPPAVPDPSSLPATTNHPCFKDNPSSFCTSSRVTGTDGLYVYLTDGVLRREVLPILRAKIQCLYKMVSIKNLLLFLAFLPTGSS